MAVIGYIRVSSKRQTLTHQRYEINGFGARENINIDRWVQEKISSREPLEKRKLGRLLESLREDDILVTTEISRLGRSLLEVMKILETCLCKNCQVWTIKENYRLGNDIQSKVLAFAFGLAAEIERNLISQRTKAGLADIRAKGKKLGRPMTEDSRKLRLKPLGKKVMRLWSSGLSKSEIARRTGVSRSAVRHFIERTEAEAAEIRQKK